MNRFIFCVKHAILGLVCLFLTFISVNAIAEISGTCEAKINLIRSMVDKIVNANFSERTEENTLDPFNDLYLMVYDGMALNLLLTEAHQDASVRAEANKCYLALVSLYYEIWQNKELYATIKAVSSDNLDVEAKKFLDKTLGYFSVIRVDDSEENSAGRQQTLLNEIHTLGTQFRKNIREDVRYIEVEPKKLDGLPEDYIKSHPTSTKTGKVTITTDHPDYIPFMTYAKNSETRKKLELAKHNIATPQNNTVLKSIIEKRHELAQLLGFDSWAAYDSNYKMAKDEKTVMDFITKVLDVAKDKTQKDLNVLLKYKRQDEPDADKIYTWDTAYYLNKAISDLYNFDSKEVRKYFSVDRVTQGVLDITGILFNVSYVQVEAPENPEKWHESVKVFEVQDSDTHQPLGQIYLDLFSRDGKYKSPAVLFGIQKGVKDKQRPKAAILANFTESKSADDPAYMDHSMVSAFFHEFGHLLHEILSSNSKWGYFAGSTTMEKDFIEIPSILLTELAFDEKVLSQIAVDMNTETKMSSELIRKLKESNEFGNGAYVSRQMALAMVALELHNKDPKLIDVDQVTQTVLAKYSPYTFDPDAHFQNAFVHLHGYSSGYYTYMWSLVIAKDFLSVFTNNGTKSMLNTKVGLQFKDAVLSKGGTKDAVDLCKDFLTRPFNFDAFESWLTD